MEGGERNSFADFGFHTTGALRAVFRSKALMAMFSTIGAGIAALYSYNGGIDLGLEKATKVTDLEAEVSALEKSLGESQAVVIGLEERLVDATKAIAALSERLDKSNATGLKRNIDACRSVVLTNAPNKRVNAMQDEFDRRMADLYPGYQTIDIDKKTACDEAFSVLRWGSVSPR